MEAGAAVVVVKQKKKTKRREREENGAPRKTTLDFINKLQAWKVERPEHFLIPETKECIQGFVDISIRDYAYHYMQKTLELDQFPIRALRPAKTFWEIAKPIQERYIPEFAQYYVEATKQGFRPKGQGFHYFEEADDYVAPLERPVECLMTAMQTRIGPAQAGSSSGTQSRVGASREAQQRRLDEEIHSSPRHAANGWVADAGGRRGLGPNHSDDDRSSGLALGGEGWMDAQRRPGGSGQLRYPGRGSEPSRQARRQSRAAIMATNASLGLPPPEGTRRTRKKTYNGLGYQVCEDSYLDLCAEMNVKDDSSLDGSAIADD